MSIITYIETGRGPSKLEMRIEAYKDRETGDIMLSPEQAKDELYTSLLADYRARVDRLPLIVKALVQIAGEEEGKTFDFTKALERFKKEAWREFKAEEERKFDGGGLNIIRPTPRVREI